MLFDLHLDLEVYLNETLRGLLGEKYKPLRQLSLERHFDFQQGKKTHLKFAICQIQSLTVSGRRIKPIQSIDMFLRNLTTFKRRLARYADVKTVATARDLRNVQRINIILGCEGLYFLKHPDEVEALWARGVRVFGLCWNLTNRVTGTILEHGKGLTEFGRQVVEKIVAHDGIVDLAHASNATRKELIRRYPNNVMLSHNNISRIHPFSQNLDDEILDLVRRHRVLVGLSFLPKALGQNSFAGWKRHYDFLRQYSPASVALGTDFFGFAFRESAVDAKNYLDLKRNFRRYDVDEHLMYNNCTRFFRLKDW